MLTGGELADVAVLNHGADQGADAEAVTIGMPSLRMVNGKRHPVAKFQNTKTKTKPDRKIHREFTEILDLISATMDIIPHLSGEGC